MDPRSRSEGIEEQVDSTGESALEASQYRGGNLGKRKDDEAIVSSTICIK